MNFQVTEKRGVAVVAIEGQIRISTQNEFLDNLNSLNDTYGDKTLIMDMTQLSYMNSAGIGIIVDTFKKFRDKGGRMILCGLSSDITKLFEVTKLNRFIEIYPFVDDAINKLML